MTAERDKSSGKERGIVNVKGCKEHDKLEYMACTTQPRMHFVYFLLLLIASVLAHSSVHLFVYSFIYLFY